jgi:hypothetical protein
MIRGSIELEDINIVFSLNSRTNEVAFNVEDTLNKKRETHVVPQAKFFKALAIAIHNDGMPDYKLDYPDAESIMQPGGIRWIP